MTKRRYEIYADNGHDGITIVYYSNHRARSRGNLEDALKELIKRFGWWAKSFKFRIDTCYLLKD